MTFERFGDEEQRAQVDIVKCADAPDEGIVSCATISLSGFPAFGEDGGELPFGVEIVAAMAEEEADFATALSTCAFNLIKDRAPIYPGAVYPRVLDLYPGLSKTLAHFLFVPPMSWDNPLRTQHFEERSVAFLQALPLAESERLFLLENGFDALEELFVAEAIDIYDIDREPVV